METSFYMENELMQLGFKKVGKNVLVSKKVSFYGINNITIGDCVRIDDFCILSGNITLENYIHIAGFCALFGGTEGILMKSYSGLSSRVSVYAESDDYSGSAMTNPMIPDQYRNVSGGHVVIGKHVIVGTGSSIMPNVTIGEGSAVGSMSLVNKSLDPYGIYAGIPCRWLKEREKEFLMAEQDMRAFWAEEERIS